MVKKNKTIVVNIEFLKVFSSGTPHREVLKKLIFYLHNYEFVLILKKEPEGFFKEYIDSLLDNANCALVITNKSKIKSLLYSILRQRNSDLLPHIKCDLLLSFDSYAFWKTNIPSIITVHDLSSVKANKYSSLNLLKRLIRKNYVKTGIRHASHIIAISEFTKNDLIDCMSIDSNKISVVHNGIKDFWFRKNFNSKTSTHNGYWIWYGNYNKRKNLLRLLRAYNNLITKGTELPRLILIGNNHGNYYKKITSFIYDKNLQHKVTQISVLEDIELKELIRKSLGLIFISLYEGFGMPIIEAYSQGVGVLTSNITSMPEIGNKYAIYVDPFDINSIEDGLLKFKEKRRGLKKNIISYAHKYSVENCTKLYLQIIKNHIN